MNYVIIPSPTTLSQFDPIVRELYSKAQNNNDQNSTLSQLRDMLLPKLMSGKIRVPVPKDNVEPD